jgi:hypothetical protein
MSNSELESIPQGREVSGKWVVAAMFAFAIVLTGFLWKYTQMHRAPFLPLRSALTKEFTKAASPRVEGGRHRRGPMTLRVVLNVDFDPSSKTDKTAKQVDQIASRIIELASQNLNLEPYEVIEIFLVQLVPEGTPQRLEIKLDQAEIRARLSALESASQ